jgi:hypothetical protein
VIENRASRPPTVPRIIDSYRGPTSRRTEEPSFTFCRFRQLIAEQRNNCPTKLNNRGRKHFLCSTRINPRIVHKGPTDNLFRQMGARKGYNPKNKGKKSDQPMLTFLAEPTSTFGENCAMAIAPMGSRSRAISTG